MRDSALVILVLVFGGVAGNLLATQNPYEALYLKSISQMGEPDELVLAERDPRGSTKQPILLAASKTCSQRCSTRCSVSCTTTKGCSTSCKTMTDGCGGPVDTPDKPTRPVPSKIVPSEAPTPTPTPAPAPATEPQSLPSTFTGMVVRVASGDTITVVRPDGSRVDVRLAGLEAPLVEDTYASISKMALSDKVLDRNVSVTRITTDAAGQFVAAVAIGGRYVNTDMVKEGWAKYYNGHRENKVLQEAEASAKKMKLGIWAKQDTPAL